MDSWNVEALACVVMMMVTLTPCFANSLAELDMEEKLHEVGYWIVENPLLLLKSLRWICGFVT